MSVASRITIDDLEGIPQPEDDTRYEIIDGELHVSTQPHHEHQFSWGRLFSRLNAWSERSGAGRAYLSPGLILAPEDVAAPDIVWISRERLGEALSDDGKLHAAPDLIVEILAPGARNERRDRIDKLAMYSRHKVREYWIVDRCSRSVLIHRLGNEWLEPAATLTVGDTLTSPLLPGFEARIADLFPES